MKDTKHIRLFLDADLKPEEEIVLAEKASHYLVNVMRCVKGDKIRCFNSTAGEFLCQITQQDKKKSTIKVENQLRKPKASEDLWLIFAPLKKDKMDFVIEKAVELGVSKIIPVLTKYTNTDKIKTERLKAQAVEAAEQCERLDVPEVSEAVELEKLLKDWDKNRILFFMDERRKGEPVVQAFERKKGHPAAVLIGPEGGFAEDEAQALAKQKFVKNVSLGPRILRAETAAAASLAVWQATQGDWRE